MTVLFHHSGATETRCSSDRRDRQEHAGAAPAVHTDSEAARAFRAVSYPGPHRIGRARSGPPSHPTASS